MKLLLSTLVVLFSFSSLPSLNAAEKYDGIIFLITGGPFNAWNPERVQLAWEKAGQEIAQTHADKNLFVQKIHQSHKDEICKAIIDMKNESPKALVILMGHSYGGHSSVEISRCLEQKKIKVDLLVTSDTVTKYVVELNSAHDVPANVVNNFHYYEDGDPFLYGTSHNYQSKPGCQIRNFLQTLGYVPFKAHMDAISNLIDYKILQTLADGALKGLNPDELDQYIKPINAAYFAKFPPKEIPGTPYLFR